MNPQAETKDTRPRLAAVVGAVVMVFAALVAVAVFTMRSHPHAAPPPTAAPTGPLDSTALPGLLLSPERVAGMVGASGMVQESMTDSLPDDSEKLPQKDCIGVMAAAQRSVYADAGSTGVRSQTLRNAGDGPRIYAVTQAVISFPNADAAKKLLAQQQSQWGSCSGRTLTLTSSSPQLWMAGTPAEMDGTTTMTQTMQDGGGMQCQRALAVRNNVVVDVSACRYDTNQQALEISRGIAAKIHG